MDLSLVDYSELIAVITAGRAWILEVFHVVVNTGIVLGGYRYPAGLLDVLRQAGIEFLIVYHSATNTLYSNANDPFQPFYAHGGLSAGGGDVSPNPNLFVFRSGASDGMIVQLCYGEDSRILNNLVNIGCLAAPSQWDRA